MALPLEPQHYSRSPSSPSVVLKSRTFVRAAPTAADPERESIYGSSHNASELSSTHLNSSPRSSAHRNSRTRTGKKLKDMKVYPKMTREAPRSVETDSKNTPGGPPGAPKNTSGDPSGDPRRPLGERNPPHARYVDYSPELLFKMSPPGSPARLPAGLLGTRSPHAPRFLLKTLTTDPQVGLA